MLASLLKVLLFFAVILLSVVPPDMTLEFSLRLCRPLSLMIVLNAPIQMCAIGINM